MIMLLGPLSIAFLVGIIVGWAWKPRWANLRNCKFDFSAPSSPCAAVLPSTVKAFGPTPAPNNGDSSAADVLADNKQVTLAATGNATRSDLQIRNEDPVAITDEDMKDLCHLVERKDGGPPWKHMMELSSSDMSYQAWQRDPETGPPQYCSRTVYEDATPELLRDFFWDDEFRLKWDDMLVHAETVEECPTTGTMIVHWIRKFPFFCSDREYIIGRRIWESGRSYYCVTKNEKTWYEDLFPIVATQKVHRDVLYGSSIPLEGVPYHSIPRREKPRRVDLFYSSWYIEAVESRKEKGQLSACEVILFHHEDMGIPWEIAKFGVRQGMWGTVRKIERSFRSYQKTRSSGAPISNSAFMAQINTKIDPDYLESLDGDEGSSETLILESTEKPKGVDIPKLLIFGGVVAVALSLDHGVFTRAIIFNVGKRLANIGRSPCPRT